MGENIQIYSVAPLISALAMYSLAIVTFFSMKKEKLWLVFAGFCLFLAAASTVAFSVTLADDLTTVSRYAKLAPGFGILAISFANYYAYLLSGARGHVRMFGRKKPSGRFFLIFVAIWVVLIALLVGSRQFVVDVEIVDTGWIRVHYGPLMYVAMAFVVLATGRNVTLLGSAYRSSADRIFKEFIVLNMAGFLLIFLPAIAMFFILPLWGKMTQPYTFFSFPVAVTIFYLAIVRYQFAQNHQLNLSLEEKVEERTAELKAAQSKLVHSEKMASMGQLVAGIAHEVNNPIGAVRSMAHSNKLAVGKLRSILAGTEFDDSAKLKPILEVMDNANRVIEDGSRKVTEVVDTLRNFAKLDEADLQMFNIHEGLEDTLNILQHEIKPGVNVSKQYNEIPPVYCYPAQLNQVFLNLLTNANEAIEGDGEITVSTFVRGGNVCITIKDSGKGIPEQNLKRIFDPGFTTKGVGVGTGLGLAICYRIIQDHKGEIEVESTVGKGTSFTVVLPASGFPGARR